MFISQETHASEEPYPIVALPAVNVFANSVLSTSNKERPLAIKNGEQNINIQKILSAAKKNQAEIGISETGKSF